MGRPVGVLEGFVRFDKEISVICARTEAGETTEHLGTRSSYIYQLEELIRALRGGTPMPTGPDDAVATAQLIDQCYRATGLPLRNRKTLTPTDRRS